jgi:hypothetical protein
MGENQNLATEVASILSAKRQRNILIIVLLLLFVGVGYGFSKYSKMSTRLAITEQNEKALGDSLRVSETKRGDLIVSKNILIAEKGNLKDLNADLANELKNVKGKVRELTKIISEIESDTVYLPSTLVVYPDGSYGLEWKHDTIYDKDNERHLAGISKLKIDSNGVVIPLETVVTTDIIKFNLTTGLREKDGNVEIFVTSRYPTLKTIELDGAIIDPKKHPVMKKFTNKKRWGIGPYVGLGLNVNTTPTPNVGLGVSFGISVQYAWIRF